jgi:MFS family permease
VRVFNIIWSGQALSLIGSTMTTFGVGIYVYLQTGSAASFTTLVLAGTLPGIVLLPVAGALVDRWDRRWAMMVSDAGSALAPLIAVVLLATGQLRLWHLYALAVLLSVFKAVQWPAFSALVPQIVSRGQLSAANGRIGVAEAVGAVGGALLGGALYPVLGLVGLLTVDVVTFTIAVLTVLVTTRMIPSAPARTSTSVFAGLTEGWRFIRARRGLFGLLVFFAANNFGMQTVIVLVPPLVLTLASPGIYGVVEAVGWAGMAIGSVVVSATREPRRKVATIMVVGLVHAVLVLAMGLTHSVWVVMAGMFGILGGYSVINAVTATLWQLKTPTEVQGRVFAVRRMISWSSQPFAYACAGLLAQYVATPLVTGDGALAGTVGRVTGDGQVGGIALLFLFSAVLLLGTQLLLWLRPAVRNVETDLPDLVVTAADVAGDRDPALQAS